MSYTIDIYRKKAKPLKIFYLLHVMSQCFPARCRSIVRYSDIAKQLRHRVHSAGSFVYGLARFNYGFAKNTSSKSVGGIADLCFSAGESSLSTPAAWIGVICYAFQIYLIFQHIPIWP